MFFRNIWHSLPSWQQVERSCEFINDNLHLVAMTAAVTLSGLSHFHQKEDKPYEIGEVVSVIATPILAFVSMTALSKKVRDEVPTNLGGNNLATRVINAAAREQNRTELANFVSTRLHSARNIVLKFSFASILISASALTIIFLAQKEKFDDTSNLHSNLLAIDPSNDESKHMILFTADALCYMIEAITYHFGQKKLNVLQKECKERLQELVVAGSTEHIRVRPAQTTQAHGAQEHGAQELDNEEDLRDNTGQRRPAGPTE